MQEGGGGGYRAIIFLVHHIFAHIHAMVLICIPKCSPFNILSSIFYLAIHAFVNEVQVEMYLYLLARFSKRKLQASIRC